MIGTWHGLVIDCKNPKTLAAFYEAVLGYVRVNDWDDWVVIGISADRPGIAFQQIENYVAPTWPDPSIPTQMHLDVRVDDIPTAFDLAAALGATLLSKNHEGCWVLADPEGHPFCLVTM
jgi:catechol 2,3-dioxygenase-like lactoylglutathione lyase family enzyme